MLLYDGPEIKVSKIWELKFVLLSNGLVAFGLKMTSFFFASLLEQILKLLRPFGDEDQVLRT